MTNPFAKPVLSAHPQPDLPLAFRNPTVDDATSDARHISELAGSICDTLFDMQDKPAARPQDFDRLDALVWIMRDMAEALHWKLNRIGDQATVVRRHE